MQSNNAFMPAEHGDSAARRIGGLFKVLKGSRYPLDGTRPNGSIAVAQLVAAQAQQVSKPLKHLKQVPETQCTCALHAAPGNAIIVPIWCVDWTRARTRPTVPNDTPKNRALNRRVEIEVSQHVR